MAIQIFDNECVESHPIYEKAGALLSDVCKRDYKDNFFDERIECLDMDTYEVMICSGQKQATMDAVIGIADYENNHKTNCKLLMVELRLGYKSTEGLEAASLNRKVSHTLELLNPAVCLVSDKAIFVFDDLLCQQAIHWMFSKRYSNVSKKEWVVMSPTMFCKAYLAPEDLPYQPIHDFVKGKADFAKMLENKSWQQIYKTLQWWGKAYYKYCYIAEEATLIASLISEVWENLKSHKHEMTDDVLLSLSNYAEDYPVFNLDEI